MPDPRTDQIADATPTDPQGPGVDAHLHNDASVVAGAGHGDAAEKTAGGGHGDGDGHDDHHHHGFSIIGAMMHHNMPYPAWEVVHGAPFLVFDKGGYAALNYDHLVSVANKREVEPSAADSEWAEQFIATPDFRWDVNKYNQQDLAKAIAVVGHDHLCLPKALSWMNQQLFFGTAALLLLTLAVCGIWRRKPEQLKPAGRVQHFFESIVVYLRDEIVRPNITHGADRWTPFLCAIFFMVLAVNLFGLIPGTGTMSGNIGVTAAWAAVVMFCMLFFGMKEQGPKFWINLVPIHFSIGMSPIWFLLLVIEVLGLVIKPAALAIRLFANMFAGHTVLLVFFSLGYIVFSMDPTSTGLSIGLKGFGWILALAFHAMEVLVAFIQAYVFTLLSALFIGMSIHPDH